MGLAVLRGCLDALVMNRLSLCFNGRGEKIRTSDPLHPMQDCGRNKIIWLTHDRLSAKVTN